MTTSLLQLLVLVLALAGTATWTFAAAADARARLLTALAGVLTAGEVIAVAVLAGRGWWFVEEKVLLGVPLAVLTGAVATWAVLRGSTPRRTDGQRESSGQPGALVRTSLVAAALGAAGNLATQVVIGYPLRPWAAAVVVAAVAAGTVTAHLAITHGPVGLTATVAAVGALTLLTPPALAWAGDSATTAGHSATTAAHGATTAAHGATTTGHVGTHGGHPSENGGGGRRDHAHHHGSPAGHHGDRTAADASTAAGTISVTDLRTPADVAGPAVRYRLEAGVEQVTLPSGRTVDAWTFGSLPGPEIRARVGDVVEVELVNRDIPGGVTIHWHGYPVPAGEDGVAGVTQDAVLPGGSFVYRFLASQTGTYWYHTHQRSAEGVVRGLYGVLVVEPATGPTEELDLSLPFHTRAGVAVLGGSDELREETVQPGTSVRLRLLNTDQAPRRFVVAGTPFTVMAVDGRDLSGPAPVEDRALRIPAGGRVDVVLTMPDEPVRVGVAGSRRAGLLLQPAWSGAAGPGSAPGGAAQGSAGLDQEDRALVVPDQDLDLLTYGSPDGEPPAPDRTVTVVLDRLPRIHAGVPDYAYTVGGLVHPNIPPTVVREGERLLLRVVNRGFEPHPMHPHGHDVRVLSVDGRAPSGSPLHLDTFEVLPGQVWEVLLEADNPGIWMDHCHNLDHAAHGMATHLVYEGVVTPFEHGGPAGNRAE